MIVSIVAAVIFVDYARRRPTFRYHYQQERTLRKAWGEHCVALRSKYNDVNKDLAKVKASLTKEIQDQRSKILDKNSQITNLQVSVADAQQKADRDLDARNKLEAHIKQQDALLEKYRTNEVTLLNDRTKLETALTETKLDLQEALAEQDRLNKSLGIVRQQKQNQKVVIVELTSKLNSLKSQLRSKGINPEASKEPVDPGQITGTVVAVADGIASINIGSANGVKKNMRFIIYRGNQYVGRIKIESVRVDQAAGIVLDSNRTPIEGDRIVNRIELGSGS